MCFRMLCGAGVPPIDISLKEGAHGKEKHAVEEREGKEGEQMGRLRRWVR